MTMPPGHDLLLMAHPRYPFDKFVKEIDRSAPIGFFWKTAGPSQERFTKLMNLGFRVFRPQMWWSDSHATVPENILRQYLEELKKTIRGRESEIILYVSPSCEHYEKNQAVMRQRLEMVGNIIPSCTPVNNPEKGIGVVVTGFKVEHHGANPGKCDLASCDGTNIYDINSAQWVRDYCNKEDPAFLWGARVGNLREIGDPGQKPPAIPARKAIPTLRDLRAIKRLALPPGAPPSEIHPSLKRATKLEAPCIWKTHAEDDQEPDENTPDELRENRPVLIIPENTSTVELLDCNARVLGKLIRYGKGADFTVGKKKFTRTYSGLEGGIGLYAYEIGVKAQKSSGSEYIWLKAGKKIYGPIHPAFRAGVQRDK